MTTATTTARTNLHVLRAAMVVVLTMLLGCSAAPAAPVASKPSVKPTPTQPVTAQAEASGPVALIGGVVHPVSAPAFEGTVVFDGGKITAVGEKVDIPVGARRIDLKGKHVYPGLFDAYTDMGLIEINAVRATRDQKEVGAINPNAKAHVAINPDSVLIPVARANGVLLTLTAPQGGAISGTSAVIQLDGWTFEDMTVKAPIAMHVNWPRMAPVRNWWVKDSFKKQAEQRDKALKTIKQAFADARAYWKAKRAAAKNGSARPDTDARWEAMIRVLEGEVPVIIRADEVRDIEAAVAFAQREKVKLILFGGYDAPHCAALLKERDVPVIIGGTHRLPTRRDDAYDAPFTLADRLRKAGVRYCISGAYQFGASMVRNLPYHAATAAAHGLPRDEALRAITLFPAQILGVADRVGSLETGKDATFIVTNGDPLETATQIELAWIAGRPTDLSSKHTRLYHRYQKKYEQQQQREAAQ